MNKTHIMIHHSLTKDGDRVSWRAIEAYHVKKKEDGGIFEFDDIGYHYGIERIMGNFLPLVGRPEQDDAAACYQDKMNRRAIHICCVGDFDKIKPPDKMLDILVKRIIKPLIDRYSMFNYGLVFHREYAPYKSCPGTKFDKEMLLERL